MMVRRAVGMLTALVALIGAWSAPAFATLSVTISNPNVNDAFGMSVTALEFRSSAGTIRCNFSFQGHLDDAIVAVPLGSGDVTIGAITSGSVSGCSPAWTWRLNGLPWALTIDSSALVGGGLYEFTIHDQSYSFIGVTFAAPTMRARTNGTSSTLNQPATLTNVASPSLTGNYGGQTWNWGPSPISIRG